MSVDAVELVMREERRPGPPLWTPVAGAVAAAWACAALYGVVTFRGVEVTSAASAAAAGTALLAGVSPPARRAVAIGTGLLGLFVLPAVLASAGSGADARPLAAVVALLVVGGAVYGGRDTATRVRAAALAGGGCALMAATLATTAVEAWTLTPTSKVTAGLLVVAGSLLAIASSGTVVAVASLRPLLTTGLLCGLVGAAALPGTGVALLAGVCAAAVAGLRAPLALAFLAIAAGALPGGQPVAAIIGAGAVLATGLDIPAAAILGLPGGVALAVALAEPGPAGPRLALGAAGIAVAVSIAQSLRGETLRDEAVTGRPKSTSRRGVFEIEGRRAPILLASAWFAIAPGSWSWAGDPGLDTYDAGMARAVGVIAVVIAGSWVLSAVQQERARRSSAGAVR